MPMAYSSKVTGFCPFNGSNFQLLHKDICGLSKVLKLDFPFNFPFFFFCLLYQRLTTHKYSPKILNTFFLPVGHAFLFVFPFFTTLFFLARD